MVQVRIRMNIEFSNHVIRLVEYDEPGQPLVPDPSADQVSPRRYYVYAHVDPAGRIFYIGKGNKRRAWSTDRHPLWHRYVEKHLAGQYAVRIMRDNLSSEEAEELEAAWIDQCSSKLVNWIDSGRDMDYNALERFHRLRNANRSLIQTAKIIEKTDPERAVAQYLRAIDAIDEYASIRYEKGLVGQLLDEERNEWGISGEIEALDRLTLCLIRLGRPNEAAQRMTDYFSRYALDRSLRAADRIHKRVEKSVARK
jgi:hypothetical protein